MKDHTGRWSLLGTSSNDFGIMHFTLMCRNVATENAHSEELMQVLKRDFDAMDEGVLHGPYSSHYYLCTGGLQIVVILDDPDCLYLCARESRDNSAMDLFITRLLDALNRPGLDSA